MSFRALRRSLACLSRLLLPVLYLLELLSVLLLEALELGSLLLDLSSRGQLSPIHNIK